ncbi:MAG: Phage protein [uncultured Clostridium sp.]
MLEMLEGCVNLNWRNKEVKYIDGTYVRFITEDQTEGVVFENEQFENLVDDYRRSIGEKTFSELEDENLELKIALENAYEIIEEKERLEDIRRERYFSPSY